MKKNDIVLVTLDIDDDEDVLRAAAKEHGITILVDETEDESGITFLTCRG